MRTGRVAGRTKHAGVPRDVAEGRDVSSGTAIATASLHVLRRRFCRIENRGWEAGIRTPIRGSRARCPTVERPLSNELCAGLRTEVGHRCYTPPNASAASWELSSGPRQLRLVAVQRTGSACDPRGSPAFAAAAVKTTRRRPRPRAGACFGPEREGRSDRGS